MDYLEATYREVVVAYLNVNSEFVRGDKNAYEIRQHGGWVACGWTFPSWALKGAG
jgi:hypothetical protein